MRSLIVLFLLLAGCSDSPESLKHRDQKRAECVEDCKPYKMKSWDGFVGCRCVDEAN